MVGLVWMMLLVVGVLFCLNEVWNEELLLFELLFEFELLL